MSKPDPAATTPAAETLAAGPPPVPAPRRFGVLANRHFLSLWLSQLTTQIGGNMVLYGLTVLVFTQTRSTSATSLLILTFLVPGVIFGAVAGVLVDRFDRRLILVSTNLLRGLAFLAMVLISGNILLVYLLNIVVSTATTFFAPSESAMIPELVKREQLLSANTFFMITLNGSIALGFALLGPIMVSLVGATSLIGVVGGLYLLAAVLTMTLPASPAATGSTLLVAGTAAGKGGPLKETFSQFREGINYIRQNPGIRWSLTYLTVAASLIGVLGALGPSFATAVLGLQPTDFVVVVLPLGLGVVLGIVALNVIGKFLPRQRVIQGGLLALAVALAGISIAAPLSRLLQHAVSNAALAIGSLFTVLSVVVVVAVVAGIAYAFVAIPSQTQLQEDIPAAGRGRVFGVLNTLVSLASFLPIILVGPLADLIGTTTVMLVAAAAIGAAGIISVLRAPSPLAVSAVPVPLIAPLAPLVVHQLPIFAEPALATAPPTPARQAVRSRNV